MANLTDINPCDTRSTRRSDSHKVWTSGLNTKLKFTSWIVFMETEKYLCIFFNSWTLRRRKTVLHRQYWSAQITGPYHPWDTANKQGISSHEYLTRYAQLRVAQLRECRERFPSSRVSNPDMHHGTCVTHMPWCMLGSLTSGLFWSRWRGKHSRRSRRMHNLRIW